MICKILYPLTNIEKLTNYKHVNLIKSWVIEIWPAHLFMGRNWQLPTEAYMILSINPGVQTMACSDCILDLNTFNAINCYISPWNSVEFDNEQFM